MWDFSVPRSFGLLLRTFPFVLLRMAVYFGMVLAYLVATGIGAGLGYVFGLAGDADFRAAAIFTGGLIGFGSVGTAVYFLREYTLYVVKAGHIAVLVKALGDENLPQGQTQISYGSAIVRQHFAQSNILFAVDQLIKGVLQTIARMLNGFTSFFPIPAVDGLTNFINAVLRIALGYVDEVILAYNFRHASDNAWQTSRTALVLYAQNGWFLVRNALWLAMINWIAVAIIFFLSLGPAAAILYLLPGAWNAYAFIGAFLFAWAFKAAVMEPFAIACLTQAYFNAIEGQTPDPEWEQRLDAASHKFRELSRKAGAAFGAPGFTRAEN